MEKQQRSVNLIAALMAVAIGWNAGAQLAEDGGQPTIAPPAPSELPDARIERGIDGELWDARAVRANDIDVSVTDGIATLSGTVDTIFAKERAVRITRMTRGVRSVVDRLTVRESQRSDEAIAADIRGAFVTDPATDSLEIAARVNGGEVTLEGHVQSRAEQRLAERVAKSVKGVRNVVSDLTLDHEASRPDDEIKTEVAGLLKWDARLDDRLILVDVADGVVTLSGSVASDYERTRAAALSWVAGVSAVNTDDLDVEWWLRENMKRNADWTDASDAELRDAIERAWSIDPRIAAFTLDAQVDDAIATLVGTTDNLKAKRAAAQAARNTVGVLTVRNYIKVRPGYERGDEEVATDVRGAIARNTLLDGQDIAVTVEDGETYLSGTVATRFERAHAADVAARVNGVTAVRNNLDVRYEGPDFTYDYEDWDPLLFDFDYDDEAEYKGAAARTDADIREDIDDELFWSPFVDANEVRVSVEDGIATLRGRVDNLGEWRAASENALEGGASKVRNQLRIDAD